MSPKTPAKVAGSGPLRSARAAQAHANNAVTWTIDLAASPARVNERAARASQRSGVALGVVAGGIWLYDIARIAGS